MFNNNDNTIASLNSRDDTIAKLNSISFSVDKQTCSLVEIRYGRMRWKVEENGTKVLQQEVVETFFESYGSKRFVTKWIDVPEETV